MKAVQIKAVTLALGLATSGLSFGQASQTKTRLHMTKSSSSSTRSASIRHAAPTFSSRSTTPATKANPHPVCAYSLPQSTS